jgi:hypothetical protein
MRSAVEALPRTVTPEEQTRRRDTVRTLNLAFWTAAREAALIDPAYAGYAYGIDRETALRITAMPLPDLVHLASAMVVVFRPAGPRLHAHAGETHGLHAALMAVTHAA